MHVNDAFRQQKDTLVHIKKADGKEWVNYSPEGCAHGISTAEANADQRKLFKQIAEVSPAIPVEPRNIFSVRACAY